VLASDKRLEESCNNFTIASFDVVRTLHSWLATNAQDVDFTIRAAARQAGGRPSGAALASPAIHAILPLAEPEDREILVAWGIAISRRVSAASRPRACGLPRRRVDLDTLGDACSPSASALRCLSLSRRAVCERLAAPGWT